MIGVMMGLGAFRFSLQTAAYQTLTRSDEYRWETMERIGRSPAMQFVGPGSTTITLEGTIYPHFYSGFAQIDEMRASASAGLPLPLVSGHGRIFGLYVIMKVDETQTIFFSNGAPRKQEFVLELKSYGADGLGGLF